MSRFGVLAFATILTACHTISLVSTTPPVMEAVGQQIVRYAGADLWLVMDYRFAAMNPGHEWLIIDVEATAALGRSVTINRDDVVVRTPGGHRVPLASQSEFLEAFGALRVDLAQMQVMGSHPSYLSNTSQPCRFDFFQTPGAGVVFEKVGINDRRQCRERLFFRVPGGVTAGRWILDIHLEESEIRVPFEL